MQQRCGCRLFLATGWAKASWGGGFETHWWLLPLLLWLAVFLVVAVVLTRALLVPAPAAGVVRVLEAQLLLLVQLLLLALPPQDLVLTAMPLPTAWRYRPRQ